MRAEVNAEIYAGLCDAFGKHPGESLIEAADRMPPSRDARINRARYLIVTGPPTGPARWARLFDAYRALGLGPIGGGRRAGS